jgi:hypothetical protein
MFFRAIGVLRRNCTGYSPIIGHPQVRAAAEPSGSDRMRRAGSSTTRQPSSGITPPCQMNII